MNCQLLTGKLYRQRKQVERGNMYKQREHMKYRTEIVRILYLSLKKQMTDNCQVIIIQCQLNYSCFFKLFKEIRLDNSIYIGLQVI